MGSVAQIAWRILLRVTLYPWAHRWPITMVSPTDGTSDLNSVMMALNWYRIGQKLGGRKVWQIWQILPNHQTLFAKFNYYCQYFNIFAKLHLPKLIFLHFRQTFVLYGSLLQLVSEHISLNILQSLLYLYIVIIDTPSISDTSLHEKEIPILGLFETWVFLVL